MTTDSLVVGTVPSPDSPMTSRRRTRHAWALAILALLGAWSAPAMARGPLSIEVLEQSASRTVVRVGWRGEGRPRGSFAVALPNANAPRLRVLNQQVRPLDTNPYPSVTPADTPVRLGTPGRMRGVWIVAVDVARAFETNDGQLRRLDGIDLELTHPAGADEFAMLRPGEDGIAWSTGAVINPAAATGFAHASQARSREVSKAQGNNDTFSHSQRWLRMEIVETGLYRVRYEDLFLLLQDEADEIDPASVRVFGSPYLYQDVQPQQLGMSWDDGYELVERALWMVAASPATGMGPGDHLLFYAAGPEEWWDRHDATIDFFEHVEHEYSDRLALWLTWDRIGDSPSTFPGSPRRMAALDATPTGTFDQSLDQHLERAHFEQNAVMAYGRLFDNWRWTRINIDASQRFNFDVDHVVPGGVTEVRVAPLARPRTNNACLALALNTTPVDQTCWNPFTAQFTGTPWVVSYTAPTLNEGSNELLLQNVDPASASINYWMDIDDFNVRYPRTLAARGGMLAWVRFETEIAADERLRYQVIDDEAGSPGWSTTTILLETTDPLSPRYLAGFTVEGDGALRFEHDVTSGVRRHYLATQDRAILSPQGYRLGQPRTLRRDVFDGGGYDYIVVAPTEYLDAANDMVVLRSSSLSDDQGVPLPDPQVIAIDVNDVYASFGYGVKEPTALRNFFKFVYNHPTQTSSSRQLNYVLLLGDANRDYRQRGGPETQVDLVPTYIQSHWPVNPDEGFIGYVEYAADDWLVSFDAPSILPFANYAPLDLPDVGTARMPAGTEAEARLMVRRAVDFVQQPERGSWRNEVLLVADDEIGLAGGDCEKAHIRKAEFISNNLISPSLDATKVYLTEYPSPPGPRFKPSARAEMKRHWSDGALIVHYIGHGSPTQLADEAVLQDVDVPSLLNGMRLPLFLGLSCDVAIFDDPVVKSMSETMVVSPAGGAIATVAATQVTFIGPNERLTDSLYEQMFPNQQAGPSRPLGSSLRDAKANVAFLDADDAHNNQKYVLFGDPALQLPAPRPGIAITGTLVDSLLTGRRLAVTASLPGPGMSGRYELQGREARDGSGYVIPENCDFSPNIDYELYGSAFFNGEGSFQSSGFAAQVPVPSQLRLGDDGRVRVLMTVDGPRNEMFVGSAEPVPVRRASSGGDDSEGPQIDLQFETVESLVAPGDTLVVDIADSSGINVLGTQPANRINLEFDDSGFPVDVTSLFHLDDGRYDKGQIRYELPNDVEPGDHQISLKATDTLGNLGEAEIAFSVQTQQPLAINDAMAFPNPFDEQTRFVVEVSDAAQLTVRVFTLDGRNIRLLKGTAPSSGAHIVEWDGRDFRGDVPANGTYLFTVEAVFLREPGHKVVRTGKVVKMK